MMGIKTDIQWDINWMQVNKKKILRMKSYIEKKKRKFETDDDIICTRSSAVILIQLVVITLTRHPKCIGQDMIQQTEVLV